MKPDETAAAAACASVAPLYRTAADQISGWRTRLVALSHSLHAQPELAFEEFASSAKVADLLEQAGFMVERGLCDLPTAFRASFGNSSLSVGFCAEYDALPEIGHACGHNIIAASAAAAAIGLAAVAAECHVRVVVLGTPAEERGGGKALMLERGAFDDIDAALMVHPGPVDFTDPGYGSLALSRTRYTFHGKAAHSGALPHLGINAGDAATIAQVAVGLLRQQTLDSTRIAGVIREAGTAPNIIPDRSVLDYEVRAPSAEALAQLKKRVHDCFRGAALATGTSLDIEPLQPDYLDLHNDDWLMNAYDQHIRAAGRTPIRLPPGSPSASTDMGNVTHALPGIHPTIAVLGSTGIIHGASFTAETATPAADDAVIAAAIALAHTAIDLALSPDQRARVGDLRKNRADGTS
jgi:amidohydrolase